MSELPKNTEKLLRRIANAIQVRLDGVATGDYCIEIPVSDARRLMNQFSKWKNAKNGKQP